MCFCFQDRLVLRLKSMLHLRGANFAPKYFARSLKCSSLPWEVHFSWNLPRTEHTEHWCAVSTVQGPLILAWWLNHAMPEAFCTCSLHFQFLSSSTSSHFWIQEASLAFWLAISIFHSDFFDLIRSSSRAPATGYHAFHQAYFSLVLLPFQVVIALRCISQLSHSFHQSTSKESL